MCSNIKFINTKKSHPVWQSQQCQCTIQQLTSIEYFKANNSLLSEKNDDVNDVISMTDNEAMRTTFLRTRPALSEDEAEAENFGLEARLASRT